MDLDQHHCHSRLQWRFWVPEFYLLWEREREYFQKETSPQWQSSLYRGCTLLAMAWQRGRIAPGSALVCKHCHSGGQLRDKCIQRT
jgi:hypothetical protein